MQTVEKELEEQLHQIPIYKINYSSKKKLYKTMLWMFSIIFTINLLVYFLLNTSSWLLIVSITLITILLTLINQYWQELFPKTEIVLVIAFGELRMMKKNQIIGFEKIKSITIINGKQARTNLPMIKIQGYQFSHHLLNIK